MRAQPWRIVLIGCLAGAVCGCAGSKDGSKASRPQPSDEAVRNSPDERPAAAQNSAFRDPIARATLRERALTQLVAAASSGLPEERVNAIEGLETAPGRLKPILAQAVTDPNIAVRTVAAMSAGRLKVTELAPQLRVLATDSAPQPRAAALFALKQLGEPVDLSPLAVMLADPSLRVRAHAAFVLGEIGEPSAVPLLRDASRRSVATADRAEVRVLDLQLAEARLKLGDETPLPEVRAALFPAKPEDLEATALACQILGGIRDHASVNRLIELVRPQNEKNELMPAEVRLAAASALAKLGQRHGAYIADQYRGNKREALRVQAALVYGDIGDAQNLPLLVDMMNDPSGRVRVAAATAVVRITEANAVSAAAGQ